MAVCIKRKHVTTPNLPQKGTGEYLFYTKAKYAVVGDTSAILHILYQKANVLATPSIYSWTPCVGDRNSTGFDTLAYPDERWWDIFNVDGDRIAAMNANRHHFLNFRDTFTNLNGFASSFECGSAEQRLEVDLILTHATLL